MKKNQIQIILSVMVFVLFSCNKPTKFTAIESVVEPLIPQEQESLISEETETIFKLQNTEQVFTQENLEKNASTISFQVKKPDGSFVADLLPSDLMLLENSTEIKNYNLTKNSIQFAQTVDIVFTVDVTGSMTDTIENAKLRLISFIENSRKAGYHTRMCLVTFGDYTIKKCDRFYDNDPNDPNTISDVTALISEISKLKALSGVQDPGGTDFDENPLRALIDAATAPWQSLNQRFTILVTDAGFLYAPGHTGDAGKLAPTYSELKAALAQSQMKVFAATPSLAGYNKKFGKELGIVDLSGGEWFNYKDLVKGTITLDSILNRILFDLNTTFVAEFVVEDQMGLDPTLPLEKRKPEVQLKNNSSGTATSILLKSNLPSGRKQYESEFKLSDKKINSQSLKIKLNETLVFDYVLLPNGKIKFNTPPAANAVIKAEYQLDELKEAIVIEPLLVPGSVLNENIEVYLNSMLAELDAYTVTDTDAKYKTINLSDIVYSSADPYRIRDSGQLKVTLKYKKSRQ
jgi:hypothetical protein